MRNATFYVIKFAAAMRLTCVPTDTA